MPGLFISKTRQGCGESDAILPLMTFALLAHGTLALGVVCMLIARWTHSGLGSCGPYGPMGLLIFAVPLVLLLGVLLVAAYWARRAVVYFRG